MCQRACLFAGAQRVVPEIKRGKDDEQRQQGVVHRRSVRGAHSSMQAGVSRFRVRCSPFGYNMRSDTGSEGRQVIEIPGYQIKREIGTGGMASVYLAVQNSLEREVAIKVMAPALAADPQFSKRFLQE